MEKKNDKGKKKKNRFWSFYIEINSEIDILFTCRFIEHVECFSKFDIFIDLILIKNLHRSIRDDDRNEEENKLLIDHRDCRVSGRDEERYWQQHRYVYAHVHH
jgi:hypothetical protein